MFKKTAIVHDLKFEPGLKLEYRFGEDTAHGWEGISYYSVNSRIEEQILNMIPASIRDYMRVSLMVINRPEIPAHIDNEIRLSINFYIETADAITKYHCLKDNEEPAIVKLPNQTDGKIYLPECLDDVGEFIAKAGEVWILDVKRPHSVSCKSKGLRVAYCVQSQAIDYDMAVRAFELE